MKRSIKASLLLITLTGLLSACSFKFNFGSSNGQSSVNSSSQNPDSSSSSSDRTSSSSSSSFHTHTPAEPVEEYRMEPTCTEDGSYDLVTYCSHCHQELERQLITIPALNHDIVEHDGKAATCTENGWQAYQTCTRCNYTTYQEIPATGRVHTATREENRIDPTCTEDGSYDLVTYCVDDNVTLSVEHKTLKVLGHDIVYHDAKAATCTQVGWQAYQTCTRCNYTTYQEIPATGHIHTATREENRVEPTCETDGSYDIVTYCLDDGEVLSRNTQSIHALGHDLVHHDAQAPTVTSVGWNEYYTCSRCAYSTYVEIPPLDGPSITPVNSGRSYKQYFSRSDYTLSCSPSLGSTKLLVIPVWFTDSNNYISTSKREQVREDIQKAYFGSNEDTGWRSVKTFYEEESHGALTMSGTVSEWYEDSRASSSFGSESTGASNTSSLVKTASDWYFNNHQEESRKDYDCDGDGYLDGVMLIYARPDYISSSSYSNGNFWAYCYWVQKSSYKNTENPGPNVFFWASYDFMYGSNKAKSRTGISSCAGGDTTHCNVDAHTFTHEMGHVFGLCDYYDYSSLGYSPAGGFSMQDHNVGIHDPHSAFSLGWGSAYVPTETSLINLKPFTTSGEMIILTPSWNSVNSPFDEYLVVEYYTPDGLNEMDAAYQYANSPQGATKAGIRLWHVDSRLLYRSRYGSYNASQVTYDPTLGGSYYVTLMMTNSYDDGSSDSSERISPLGSAYANYNQLQWIRNNKNTSHKSKTTLTNNYLFHKDDVFTMEDYKKQFVNEGKLNSDSDLGFSFEVKELGEEYATIAINKL